MNRQQRHASGRHPDSLLERLMKEAGIPASEKERFLKSILRTRWQEYKQERMNQRILIENQMQALGLRFRNGTVNKDYAEHFRLPVRLISDVRLEGTDALGLSFEIDGDGACSLTGRPSKPGDFNLTLRYRTVEGEPPSEMKIPIAFNPDPRKLWNDIPTPRGISFHKPDSDVDFVGVPAAADGSPRKDMVAASRRGRSHAHEGKPRDDHFSLYHCDRSDWYIMAVADGAGSAKFSRKGSEVACEAVVDHCRRLLIDNPDFEEAIRLYAADRDDRAKRTEATRHVIDIVYKGAVKAHQAVKEVVEANAGTSLRDYATTLMFTICKKYDFGWFIASFWVGDGAMAVYDASEGTVKLLGTPDEGEYSGQTRFLTMPEIFRDPEIVSKRIRMAIVPDFTALFLMTDGVSDPMFETDRNLSDPAKWKELYENIRSGFPDDGIPGVDLSDDNEAAKDQLLHWLDFWSPGNHDDRTIAMLV